MSDIHYFCPQCAGPEIKVVRPAVIDITKMNGGATASCELCGWEGLASELVGALRPQHQEFWTMERVGNTLLYVASKHAVGPLLQVLERVGLLPAIKGSAAEQQSAREVREAVVKAGIAALISALFEEAAKLAPQHFERFDAEQAAATEKVFSFAEVQDGQGS